MLIQRVSILKTILILLLFSQCGLKLNACIALQVNHTERSISFSTDTIAKKMSGQDAVVIPDNQKNETINFQVNSEISYYSFSHFVKAESKQLFYNAWMKAKEVQKLSLLTDSLRKSYVNSSDEQKEKITALILSAEKQTIAINDEVPALYEKARKIENEYWLTASNDEKAKFLEKIKSYKDSLQQVILAQSQQSAMSLTVPDTITYYRAEQKAIADAEPASAIVYKIQVGAYKAKMPESASKAIKKLSVLRKVENYKDEKGVTVYTTGNLKKYQEAVTLQNQVKLEGIKNATIVAYNNGKRITLEEARKLNNEPAPENVKPN